MAAPSAPPAPRPLLLWGTAAVAVVVGLLTLRSGGLVLFGPEAARRAAGAYVPLVLWFNFLAGFCYVAAGVGLFLRRRRAAGLALGIAVATAVVYAALGVHIALGGAFEPRTVGAMAVRLAVWLGIWWVARRALAAPRRAPGG